jgi:hypothetical protein
MLKSTNDEKETIYLLITIVIGAGRRGERGHFSTIKQLICVSTV